MIVGKGIWIPQRKSSQASPCAWGVLTESSGLAPEIAMWRLYTDDLANEEDWYIKPNQYVLVPTGRQPTELS
jgi:hypothetical protein